MRWNLKLRLLRAGRPSWQIAQELGLRADLLSKIVSGSVDPKPDVRERLAAFFGVAEEELFERSNGDRHGVPAGDATEQR